MRDEDKEWLIQRALALARPFRSVNSLVLENYDYDDSQRREIIRACEQKIRAGDDWWRIPVLA